MFLTKQQEDIIQRSKLMQNDDILKIEACAGSGKTFTLVQIACANPDKKFLYLAFNRAIVKSAQNKFPQNVTILTTHALAYRAIVQRFFKGRQIVGQIRPKDLQSLFIHKSVRELKAILMSFNAFLYSKEPFCKIPEVLTVIHAIERGALPMTHDYYLKLYQVYEHKNLDIYDCLMLDEAQDTNDVTLSIFMNNHCAKIVVGDTSQSIYGFRGSINALDKIETSNVATLSVSFRSDNDIVQRANYFINTYTKPQNFVDIKAYFNKKQLLEKCGDKQNQAIITRTNAALIHQIANIPDGMECNYNLIKNPNDVFLPSIAIYYLKENNKNSIPISASFIKRFKTFAELELYAKESDDPELKFAIQMTNTYGSMLFFLYEKSKYLYQNSNGSIVLTNAHQAKGLEWDNVTLDSDFPSLLNMKAKLIYEDMKLNKEVPFEEIVDNFDNSVRTSRVSSELIQEGNLYYVAITRAKVGIIDLTDNHKEYASYMDGEQHIRLLKKEIEQVKLDEKILNN